jgi:hypothetical protein
MNWVSDLTQFTLGGGTVVHVTPTSLAGLVGCVICTYRQVKEDSWPWGHEPWGHMLAMGCWALIVVLGILTVWFALDPTGSLGTLNHLVRTASAGGH